MKHPKTGITILAILFVLLTAGGIVAYRIDKIAERVANEKLQQMVDEQHVPLTWSGLHLRIGHIHWLKLLCQQVVQVDRVRLSCEQIAYADTANSTSLQLDSLTVEVHDICYNLRDSSFAYNDSVYLLQSGRLAYTSPDSLFEVTIGSLYTRDAGEIVLKYILGGNTDKPEEHADRMGKQEVTWARFNLQEVRVSAVNVIRLAQAQEINIDSVGICGKSTNIYYDSHYPPKEPYPMPSESLLAIKMPLNVGHLDATLKQFHVAVTTDGKHAGTLELKQTHARIRNISNRPGSTMRTTLQTHFADGGTVKIATDMTMNKHGSLTFDADITQTTGSNLASLTKPLLGVELKCNFHSISTRCTGDSKNLRGTFCMQYDSLSIHVDEDNPMEELGKFAGIVNTLAPVVLYNKNPRSANAEPKSFEVGAKHDPMQPFPAYFIGVINDGMLQTILPFGIGKGLMQK